MLSLQSLTSLCVSCLAHAQSIYDYVEFIDTCARSTVTHGIEEIIPES